MRSFFKYTGTFVVLLVLLEACTGLPSAPAPAATQAAVTAAPAATEAPGSTQAAPAATEAPGSTQAAPAGTSLSTNATTSAPGSTEMPAVASLAEQNPTALPATTTPEAPVASASITTAAPEPTIPPAPTAPPATKVATAAACTHGALTPEQTEGPYYKANPPESSSLLQPGMNGTRLTITGYVLDAQCQPVPGARVDFWQADSEGQYDNQGYTLRGYEVTDAEGRYSVETVVPGLYPGRTRHIHVKVTPRGGQTLTTQLYFPDEAANARDRIFSSELVMHVEKTTDGELGTFNFVIKTQ